MDRDWVKFFELVEHLQATSPELGKQIQAARRAFEGTLKELLRAERRSFASNQSNLYATEEEVVAGLAELKEHGGLELDEFIGELEQVLHDRERTAK